ncbi:MAG: hypothetical protein JWO41_473 [Candidatus Saccharibacteria bacterium]|nr:hypothetical protein [Candidatus Saccharibacteria bacterium]
MQTIVVITTDSIWKQALQAGEYTQSTIDSTLSEVGFIHCTIPEQTITIANRHFSDKTGLILVLIDKSKVTSEVKFEASLSGRPGLYPHIYGPLNINAAYAILPLEKDASGQFIEPEELKTS